MNGQVERRKVGDERLAEVGDKAAGTWTNRVKAESERARGRQAQREKESSWYSLTLSLLLVVLQVPRCLLI